MRPFAVVVDTPDGKHAVIAPSMFATVRSAWLRTFDRRYDAEEFAKQVNALARAYKDPRAAAARERG